MLIILGIFVFSQFNTRGPSKEVEYSTFLDFVEEGQVDSVTIERSNGRISGELGSPTQIPGNNGEQVRYPELHHHSYCHRPPLSLS